MSNEKKYEVKLKKLDLSNRLLIDDDVFSVQQRIIKQIAKKDDEYTIQAIKDYVKERYANENVRIDILDEDVVDEIVKLGIAEYERRIRIKEEKK